MKKWLPPQKKVSCLVNDFFFSFNLYLLSVFLVKILLS